MILRAHFHLPFCACQRVEERQPPASEFLGYSAAWTLERDANAPHESPNNGACQDQETTASRKAIMVAAKRCQLQIRTGKLNSTPSVETFQHAMPTSRARLRFVRQAFLPAMTWCFFASASRGINWDVCWNICPNNKKLPPGSWGTMQAKLTLSESQPPMRLRCFVGFGNE